MRVLLAPLMGAVPCTEAVAISLMHRPRLKFRLVPLKMGVVNGIPGLVELITNIINNVLVDMLLWPGKLVVPLVELQVLGEAPPKSPEAARAPIVRRPPPPPWVKTLNQLLVPLRFLFPAPVRDGDDGGNASHMSGMTGPLPSSHLDWLKARLAEVCLNFGCGGLALRRADVYQSSRLNKSPMPFRAKFSFKFSGPPTCARQI